MHSFCTEITPVPDAYHDSFAILYNENTKSLLCIHYTYGILKYSFDTNEWIKQYTMNRLSSSFFEDAKSLSYPITIDSTTNTIYFLTSTGHFAKINLNTNNPNNWDTSYHNNLQIGDGAQIIMINQQLHIIGGYLHQYHSILKFNDTNNTNNIPPNQYQQYPVSTKNQFEKSIIAQLDAFVSNHRIIRVQGNKLIMFGGYDRNTEESMDSVKEYDINTNQWQLLQTKLPTKLHAFGCISVYNDQYILLFGGGSNRKKGDDGVEIKMSDDILVYNVKDKVFRKSNKKCPRKGFYDAVKVSDIMMDEKIMYGFVRDSWRTLKVNHVFPSHYLIKIMCGYYLNEFVHLFNSDVGEHWRLNVFDIISDCEM